MRRIGIFARQLVGDELCLMQFVVCGLVQREQRIFQRLRIGLVMAGNEAGRGLREIDQRGIDTVQAGAGHDADVEVSG